MRQGASRLSLGATSRGRRSCEYGYDGGMALRHESTEALEQMLVEWRAAIEDARDPATGKCRPCTERKFGNKIATVEAILDRRRAGTDD